jgi:two-component system sensor histidine kinase MprB
MSFRRRIVLLAAAAVAAAVVLASVAVYVVTGNELRGQVDTSLRTKLTPGKPQSVRITKTVLSPADRRKLETAAATFARQSRKEGATAGAGAGAAGIVSGSQATGKVGPGSVSVPGPLFFLRARTRDVPVQASGGTSAPTDLKTLGADPLPEAGGLRLITSITHKGHSDSAFSVVLPAQGFGGASGYAQLVTPDGQVLRSGGSRAALPITAATHAVATGKRGAFFSDATIAGTHMRVLTEAAPGGAVWQVALPLTDVNSTLRHLLLVLAAVSVGGILLAAALGLLVSRAALVPVRRLTAATQRVASTQDLAHRIPTRRADELGRLAESFNTMLAALERSRLSQRQLVSDASHELRTPLTSIQANLDALALGDALSARERSRAVSSAQTQLRELGVLVGDLVDLSKTEVDEVEVEDVRLDLAVQGAIRRARARAPQCVFSLEAEPCVVRAAPARLDRAISNLLDNAVKWTPDADAGGAIEVRVHDGRVQVRDHGPGIDPGDLPRVFDRFYRAPAARSRPGSGLGLAIVRHLAETHGGAVHAANHPLGGAVLTLELPPLPFEADTVAEPGGGPAFGAAARVAVHEAPRIR